MKVKLLRGLGRDLRTKCGIADKDSGERSEVEVSDAVADMLAARSLAVKLPGIIKAVPKVEPVAAEPEVEAPKLETKPAPTVGKKA